MISAAKAKIDQAKNELTLMTRATVDRRLVGQDVGPPVPGKPPVFASTRAKADAVADKQKALAAARDRLALLERGEMPIPSLPAKPAVGGIGRVELGAFDVWQVIDETNMTATLYDGDLDISTYWLRGWPTANLASNLRFNLTGKLVRVPSLTQHELANGEKISMLVLEPFDIDQARAAWDKRRAQGK